MAAPSTSHRAAASGAVSLIYLVLEVAGAQAQGGVPRAFVAITPGAGFNATTYKRDGFRIRNDSSGAIRITEVAIDLKTALFPDMVYDPLGAAGDVAAKCLEANSGAAGSVSGLELSGATVTVHFDDGTTVAGHIFRQPGTTGGGVVAVTPGPLAAPSIDILAVSEPASTDDAAQTVRVSAMSGASVRLLRVEAGLELAAAGGFDLDAFEGNEALLVDEHAFNVGAGGFVDVAVTLTRQSRSAGLNYFMAVAVDPDGSGRTGATSNVGVLELRQGCSASGPCEDGNLCTTGDTCTGGECTGATSCGAPLTRAAPPTTSDALYILRAAVNAVECDACECDVDSSGSITASDALLALQASVGLGVEMRCFAPAA